MLLGGGMLMASLMATVNYDNWEMDNTLLESVIILGLGPIIFTCFCIIFSSNRKNRVKNKVVSFKFDKSESILFFLCISIFLEFMVVVLKIKYYESYFGGSTLQETIFAFRLDSITGESSFSLPSYVGLFSKFTFVMSYISSLIMSIMIVFKIRNWRLMLLLIIVFLLSLVNAMLSGTKGAIMDILVNFSIIYIILLYSKIGNYKLPNSFYKRIMVIVLMFALFFQSFGFLIGRTIEERTNFDILSEYCGAQIKNFDIYMHGKDRNPKVSFPGEDSFSVLRRDLSTKNVATNSKKFQYVKGHNLGNVYTQYHSFHRDLGLLGVVLFSLFIAYISMKVYQKAMKDIWLKKYSSLSLFIYSNIAFSIFMSFFSFRMAENIFSLNFVKNVIAFSIVMWIVKKLLTLKIS